MELIDRQGLIALIEKIRDTFGGNPSTDLKTDGKKTVIDAINEVHDRRNDAGDGIVLSVSGLTTTISAKIDEVAPRNYVSASDSGLLVDGMGTQDTKTDEDIQIFGLSGTFGAGNYSNGDVIRKGTSVSEILKKILQKVIYPNAATKPSAKLTAETTIPSSCEVGTLITFPSLKIEGVAGKFNYSGYSGPEAQGTTFANPVLKVAVGGGYSGYTATADYGDSPIAAQDGIIVTEGSNTITVDGKINYTAPSNLPQTNTGEETKQTSAVDTDNMATWDAGTATARVMYSTNGYRRTFAGVTSSTVTADSVFIRSLGGTSNAVSAGGTFAIKTTTEMKVNRMVIASPRKVATVKNSTGTQDLTAILNGTLKTVGVEGASGYAAAAYNVYDYTWASDFGNETWIITFA